MSHVPRADARDQGVLPEELRHLSYELAVFLRYQAARKHMCDKDGWVYLRDALTEIAEKKGVRGTEEQVQEVVQNSYSKDQPRFEMLEDNGRLLIRAYDRKMYLERHDQRNSQDNGAGK